MTARRWIALGLAVVAATGLAVVANTRRTSSIGRGGSATLDGGRPVVITTTPGGYRVDYRLEERVGDNVRISTEKVWVRRPFDSRVETWVGAPPGRSRLATDVATLGRSATGRVRAETSVSDQPPAIAAADVRLGAALPAALDTRVLQRREQRRVLGRACQVYRSGTRVAATTLRRPTAKTFVDTCIDRDGLLLEEVQTVRGTRQTRRVAIRVDLRPALPDTLFAVGTPNLTVPNGGGDTRALVPTSTPPGQFWQLDGLEGFTLVGRYSVVPPQPENFIDERREGFRQAGVSDVYRRGLDVVVLDQGATLRAQPPFAADPRNPQIDLGPLGRGEILITGRGAEVRALTGGGHYVRIFGTLAPADLAAIAHRLHQVTGGQLEYLN